MPTISIKSKTTKTITTNTLNTTQPLDSIAAKLETKTADITMPVSKPVDVIPVENITSQSSSNEVELPRHLFTGFADVLREQMVIVATQIAEKYLPNTPVEDVIKECVPDAPKVKTKKQTKTKKPVAPKITDFKEATCLEDLKVFKMPELKDICSSHSLPITGAKKLLMARVWGISHPEDAPKEEKKKRGRKPGSSKKSKTATVDVEDSAGENEDEEFELDPDNMETVFVSSDSKIVEKDTDGATAYKLKLKFLFLEKEDSFDFAGVVDNDTVTFMEDPPEELLKLLGAE